jgi:epoxyqueuosine reductase
MGLAEQIKQKAIELGFDLVGITDALPIPKDQVDRLLGWLDAGYAGRMTWMHKNLEKRTNPAKLLPGAQSVIVVGLNYKPSPVPQDAVRPASPSAKSEAGNTHDGMGRVAAYARYEDYHPFIKKQLRSLVDFIVGLTGPGLKFKICVDSTPLLERAFAAKAGLGFIGKNHALINPRLGPQIFLGEILTNLDLACPGNSLAGNQCHSCNKCVSACPTGALRADGSFDATKCISYLTIESNTDIPSDLAPKIGNHLFGCAECLLACPYQQSAPPCANKEFVFHADRTDLDLKEVINLTEEQFQSRFANSPILRPGLSHIYFPLCLIEEHQQLHFFLKDTPINREEVFFLFRLLCVFCACVANRRFSLRLSSELPFLWSTRRPQEASIISLCKLTVFVCQGPALMFLRA